MQPSLPSNTLTQIAAILLLHALPVFAVHNPHFFAGIRDKSYLLDSINKWLINVVVYEAISVIPVCLITIYYKESLSKLYGPTVALYQYPSPYRQRDGKRFSHCIQALNIARSAIMLYTLTIVLLPYTIFIFKQRLAMFSVSLLFKYFLYTIHLMCLYVIIKGPPGLSIAPASILLGPFINYYSLYNSLYNINTESVLYS